MDGIEGRDYLALSRHSADEVAKRFEFGGHNPFIDEQYGMFDSFLGWALWFQTGQTDDTWRKIDHSKLVRSSLVGLSDVPGLQAEGAEVVRRFLRQRPQIVEYLRDGGVPLMAVEITKLNGFSGRTVNTVIKSLEWYARAFNEECGLTHIPH